MIDIELSNPGTTYRATRFDWTGVFERVSFNGREYAGRWFDGDDPLRHDNLCGMSEEFSPIWLDDRRCLKTGVGILDVPGLQVGYDRFKLYDIADNGVFEVENFENGRTTYHIMEGYYNYSKQIHTCGEDSFQIVHKIVNTGKILLQMTCYNHNFITFGKDCVGRGRKLDFPGRVDGVWRPDSSPKASMQGNGLRFSDFIARGEKAFIGNLRYEGCERDGYAFSVREQGDGILPEMAVEVCCDVPMEYAVFWTNDRVACVEPYVGMAIAPGNKFEWTINYKLI